MAWDEDGSLEAGADVGRGHLVAGLLMGPGDLVGPAAVEHVVDDAGAPAMAVCKRMHECLRAARREECAYSSFFRTATKTHLFSAPALLFSTFQPHHSPSSPSSRFGSPLKMFAPTFIFFPGRR